ncbi:DegT/DnrJ/EryC1/StrS family aminotransferase [Roseofilum capinflatum]|uniref:DegT/DnrJ/EryC1/StrS family aminotransferase n=1 Tax=Roseofilum capinflatum BLCC-M114 TaxID=3022440 RepID=A0ABT7B0H7_9CYAN|nr:DegT/DnrJ/EryC1/StrS family aminotransferase [Roseofilum capinflatum]MDJ1172666.1 DegT/DnrJ/EryC1/StrS family aminotransferase [Roseofilum capinflatum BLCC-M114]
MLLQTNPKAGYLAQKTDIDQAIHRVLESGWYILGEEVTAFEKEFAQYMGASYAVGVASGTDALVLALKACGIGLGDAVITVSHTAVATVTAIELAGATPILVDIDPVTFTLDPNSLEDTLVELNKHPHLQVKAIIPVHLYGHPADMTSILEIARRYELEVIEDCAQSHGAIFNHKKTGTWGKVGAFSFYPTKNLGALGDGGAVITDDAELANQLLILRQYGWKQRFISDASGMNSRLDPIQAAILRVKLSALDQDNKQRKLVAKVYDRNLSDLPLTLPQTQGDVDPVYHQYVIRSDSRDTLQQFLKAEGIGTAIHYPVPVHQQPAYQQLAISPKGLSVTEKISREILSLPMYGQLTDEEATTVSQAVIAGVKSFK